MHPKSRISTTKPKGLGEVRCTTLKVGLKTYATRAECLENIQVYMGF